MPTNDNSADKTGQRKDRRDLFVTEYMKDLDGKNAAIRAGYSPQTARIRGSQLLRTPYVRVQVDAAKRAAAKKVGVTKERWLRELELIGFSDLADYIKTRHGKVTLKNLEGMPKDVRRVLESVMDTKQGVAVKLHPKIEALKVLGKHLGFLNDRIDVALPDGPLVMIMPRPNGNGPEVVGNGRATVGNTKAMVKK